MKLNDIDWSPYYRAWYMRHRKLIQPSANRIQIVDSNEKRSLFLLFFLLGLVMLVPAVLYFLGFFEEVKAILIPSFLSIISIFLGGSSLFSRKQYHNIDKAIGYYWYGSPKLDKVSDITALEAHHSLKDIVGIQGLLYVDKDPECGNFDAYEINLILQNGERFSLLAEPDKGNHFSNEMLKLQSFLNLPILEHSDAREQQKIAQRLSY